MFFFASWRLCVNLFISRSALQKSDALHNKAKMSEKAEFNWNK